MVKIYSMEIARELKDYLDGKNWKYGFDQDYGIFRFGINLNGNMKTLQCIIEIRDDSYVFYAISPISANQEDERQMMKMAEFVCRANYGLLAGNFEFDFRDAELRYKYYVNCDGILPTYGIINDSVHIPAAMFSRYGDGILQILFNDMPAEEAVELCEGEKMAAEETEEDADPGEVLSPEEKADLIERLRRRIQ